MDLEKFEVVITGSAEDSLRSILSYISKRTSGTAAKKVGRELLQVAKSLKYAPRRYSIELELDDHQGKIRSVSKWSYKIIYEIEGNQVLILDFFHTSQDPSKIEDISKGQ